MSPAGINRADHLIFDRIEGVSITPGRADQSVSMGISAVQNNRDAPGWGESKMGKVGS